MPKKEICFCIVNSSFHVLQLFFIESTYFSSSKKLLIAAFLRWAVIEKTQRTSCTIKR